jgi:ABC transporter substrate binding protein (PQQ-dependent alcohol dehydrogenase system)
MKLSSRLPFLALTLLCLAAPEGLAKKSATPGPSSPPKAAAAEPGSAQLRIAYLAQERESGTPPYFDAPIPDRGISGARLGIDDNNTTGRFTRQRFELAETVVPRDGDVALAFQRILADGYRHLLVDLPAETLAQLAATPEAAEILIYDISSSDDRLRGEGCAPNVVHLLPSRAMRADALAQFLAKKRWTKWFLVVGPEERDRLYAEAIERAGKRFGGTIVAHKTWRYEFDERRTPESEIPVLTQGAEYDVLIVADEDGSFGDYLPYRTWLPRPVVGTQGLVPTAWHRTHEAWGALQLQNRFRERAGRWMTEADYGAWLAVRAIGESATRAATVDFPAIRSYLLSDQLALAGFKGVPLSFRPWDGQLRQPVLLAQERSLVAVAPIEGFIHPRNELDTLGYDQSETACRAKP